MTEDRGRQGGRRHPYRDIEATTAVYAHAYPGEKAVALSRLGGVFAVPTDAPAPPPAEG
ncbi:hypothetical protein [Pseudonocardia xishanensis]|uniref:Uncharacterized protein n=1 Tax=Pseudonocardia xishanensis TaxID=630995 RepID=A0ABP8RPE9_9PSEU